MENKTSNGLLLVIKATECHACKLLTKNGFFKSLMNNLVVGDVVQLELDEPSGFAPGEPNSEIFNIEDGYPSFKYMTIETYDNLSSFTTHEALKRICFFNGRIVDDKFVRVNDYQTLTLDTMQAFCNASAAKLSNPQQPVRSIKTNPIPKYVRK